MIINNQKYDLYIVDHPTKLTYNITPKGNSNKLVEEFYEKLKDKQLKIKFIDENLNSNSLERGKAALIHSGLF